MAFDAIIIGAGPAGSAAASLLARAGWKVALVEKAEFPRRKVCGEFISAPTHAILDLCGVGDAFRALAGPPVRRIALFSGDRVVTANREKDWGRALGREHLDLMMRDAAVTAGAVMFQPAELIAHGFAGGAHACRIKADDNEITLTAPILVAATGSWRSKQPFGITAPPRGHDLLAFKAHFRGGALAPGIMPLLVFPGGYGGMVETDGGRTSLSCCIRRDVLAGLRRPGEAAGETVLRHIRASTQGARQALETATLDGAILSAGPIRPGIRAACQDGVFYSGNLAGEAHPIIAEGISMAIQSSHLLARHLLARDAEASYAAAWRNNFAPRLAAASLFAGAALHAPRSATQLVRAFPGLLSWGAAISGKVPTSLQSQAPKSL